jgi:hypothetical protein
MKKLYGFLCVLMSFLLISSSALAAGSIQDTIFKRDYSDIWVFNQPYVVLRCTPLGGGKMSTTVENQYGVFGLNDYAKDLGAKSTTYHAYGGADELYYGSGLDITPFADMALSMCDQTK